MKALKVLKNIVLFLLAPFIALAYIIALPAVGMYMFVSLAIELVHKRATELNTSSWNNKLAR
jgi:hypothetical protein